MLLFFSLYAFVFDAQLIKVECVLSMTLYGIVNREYANTSRRENASEWQCRMSDAYVLLVYVCDIHCLHTYVRTQNVCEQGRTVREQWQENNEKRVARRAFTSGSLFCSLTVIFRRVKIKTKQMCCNGCSRKLRALAKYMVCLKYTSMNGAR